MSGKRVRANFIEGVLSVAMTDAATTMESEELANLPAIAAGEYAVIVLGDEVLYVTAHTAAANTATVTRGRENTAAVAHDAAATWQHTPTIRDFRESYEPLAVIAAGATETLDVGTCSAFKLTLSANCTLTFSSATTDEAWSFGLFLVQDATGGRTITWPASVLWAGGTAPTLSTTANAIDYLVFTTFDGGTTWLGALAGANFS